MWACKTFIGLTPGPLVYLKNNFMNLSRNLMKMLKLDDGASLVSGQFKFEWHWTDVELTRMGPKTDWRESLWPANRWFINQWGKEEGICTLGGGEGWVGDYLEYAKPEFGINPVFDKLLFLHSFSLWLFWNISLSRFKSCNESNLDVAFIPPTPKKEAHDWTAANIFKSELFCPRGDGVMDRAFWLSGLCSSPAKSKCFSPPLQTRVREK